MDAPTPTQRIGREGVWVLAMTLLGGGLRLKGLGRLGLDHFDAGIYAQAGLWALRPGGLRSIDPGLIPYAPPGYPALVGVAYRLLGPSDTAVLIVSILAGVLTIPVVAWLSRRSFGPGAGAVAASLAALSGTHVVFSRAGLTDSTFLLVWLLAIGLGMRFLERPGAVRAVLLGVAVGLAQLVKYNGAMAGILVAIAAAVGAVVPGDRRRMAHEALPFGVLAAVVAGLVYLPWYNFVEHSGGYASLMAHHRGYVDGLFSWPRNWRLQMDQVESLAGLVVRPVTWGSAAMALGWLGGAIGQGGPGRTSRRGRVFALSVVPIIAVGLLAAPANLPWWLALASLPLLVGDGGPGPRLVAVWWLSMALVTPLYHPYARLWLPEVAAGWVAVGGLTAGVLGWLRGAVRGVPSGRPARIAIVGLLALVGLAVELAGPWLRARTVQPFPTILGPSDGVRLVAERLKARFVEEGATAEVACYARQTLPFYLAEEGLGSYRMAADLPGLVASAEPGQVAVVDAAQGVTLVEVMAEADASRWELLGEPTVPLGLSTLLDVRPESIYDPADRHLGGGAPPAEAAACTFWIFRVGSGPPVPRPSP